MVVVFPQGWLRRRRQRPSLHVRSKWKISLEACKKKIVFFLAFFSVAASTEYIHVRSKLMSNAAFVDGQSPHSSSPGLDTKALSNID